MGALGLVYHANMFYEQADRAYALAEDLNGAWRWSYYRALVRAGVAARGRTVLGVGHAGDLMFRRDNPENYWATLHDIHSFCAR